MLSKRNKTVKLLAIVGPTASGKSELAMRLAKEFDGEIICADSRTIYKGMDIGTAKPSAAEQKEIPHWGLDLVKPGQTFSAAKFKDYAEAKVKDIQNRGRLPILVGGTGLYLDAVLYDFQFSPVTSERDPLNPRHLKKTTAPKNKTLRQDVILIGLNPSDELLRQRIATRAEQVFGQGIIKETQSLVKKYGQLAISGTGGIAYQAVLSLIRCQTEQTEAIKLIQTKEWQYARRQKTWFKRSPHIKWFNSPAEAYKVVKKELLNT